MKASIKLAEPGLRAKEPLQGAAVNDLIKLVLAQIPKYISNLLTLVSQPKRFIRKKRPHSDESLTEALTFLGITFVLGLILRSSFIPEETNFWQYVGTREFTIYWSSFC